MKTSNDHELNSHTHTHTHRGGLERGTRTDLARMRASDIRSSRGAVVCTL